MSPRDEKTAIFWDLDGEAIPPIGMGISEACESLRYYGHDYGRVCEFKAYISPASDTELSQSTRLASDLRQNGVALSLHHPSMNGSPTSSSGAKELVMLADIMIFVLDHEASSATTIMLVTNDHSSLGYPLSLLRNRNCQVVVLSTRETAGQPRYVQRLDAIWNVRGEIQAPPPPPRHSSSPRLTQAARVIQSPHQNRVRSQSRGQSGFALPALLRGTPQLMPAASASPRQAAVKRSNSLAFHGEDNIPSLDLGPSSVTRYVPSTPRMSPPRNDVSVYHNGREAQPVAQHMISNQMAPSLSHRSSISYQHQPAIHPPSASTPPNRSRANSRAIPQPSMLNIRTEPESDPSPESDPAPETARPQSPPRSASVTPSSPWSFNSSTSNHPPPIAPPVATHSVSDNESQSTITRDDGRVSPSISTQSTNLWLHDSMGLPGGGESTYIDMPRGESPLTLGLPTSLAFDHTASTEKTARPEPHAFTFRPPPTLNAVVGAPASNFRMGSVDQIDEHRSFAGTGPVFGNPSVHSASTRFDSIGNSIELKAFDPPSFQRFGSVVGTPGAQFRNSQSFNHTPASSIDRGIPYPSNGASSASVSTIQPIRPPVPQSPRPNNQQAHPRSPRPRAHSRLSSYSASAHSAGTGPSSASPPTPLFGAALNGLGVGGNGMGFGMSVGGIGGGAGPGVGSGPSMHINTNIAPNPPHPAAAPVHPIGHGRMSSISSVSSTSSFSMPPSAVTAIPPPPLITSNPSNTSATGSSLPTISFHPLIRILEKFRAQGSFAPLRSAVGSELRQADPHIYDKLDGVRTFKEYAGAAERSGLVVLIGGSPGKEKIALVK